MNPFKRVSKVLDTVDEHEKIAFVVCYIGLLLGGAVTHAYDRVASLAVLALVNFILALAASLLLGAILRFLAKIYDEFV